MMEESRTFDATCECGGARHEITLSKTALPVHATFCHCTSCRRMSGSLCITSIQLLTEDDYRPETEVLTKLQPFEFSKNQIIHYFCSTCGTHMLAHVLPREQNKQIGRWFAMCSTFENADNLYWPRHEYIADTLDGGIAEFLPSMNAKSIERWAGHPGNSEQLPLHWSAPERSQHPNSSHSKLHAHCKCRGVEFWIARPSDGSKYKAKMCGCDNCRLRNGMEWFVTAVAQIPNCKISLDEDGGIVYLRRQTFGTLKYYRASPTVEKAFCRVCGATVFLTSEGMDMMKVAVGLFAADEGARAETWLDWSLENLKLVDDNWVQTCG